MNIQRKHMRLEGYDYSRAGYYFVTICVKLTEIPLSVVTGLESGDEGAVLSNSTTGCVDIFGKTQLRLTDVGKVVESVISTIHAHSSAVSVVESVIMPDHVHLLLKFDDYVVDERSKVERGDSYFSKISPYARSLGVVVRQFKAAVTGILHKQNLFNFKWQGNYYDHIVRNSDELHRIRKYIKENPQKLLVAQLKNNKL